MENSTNSYYVYVYYRLDTNEPFYVGKGKGDRWKRIDKTARGYNKHFINIVKNISIAVVIEKDNLTEQESFYWEEKIIETLVFEYGFSIETKGCNSKNHYCHLVNQTWGGEGGSGHIHTEEAKRKMSEKAKGRQCSEETKRKIGESNKGKGHTEEWKRKVSGENNPNYGKHFSDEHRKKISDAKKGVNSGKDNYQATTIICVTTGRIFYTIKEGAEYYNCYHGEISYCCRGYRIKNGKKIKILSAGKLPDGTPLVWRYIEIIEL